MHEIIFHIFLAPAFDQFGGVGFQRVDAGESFRRRVVPFEQLPCFLVAEIFPPALHEPFGMRPAERGLGDFHVGENLFHLVEFAQIGAQDGVDEAGLRDVAGALGLLDGLMDGGVRRNAVEPENLVEAEPQQVDERRARLAAGRGLARDEPVERRLPADDAADELVAKPAVRRRKARGGQGGFEEILGEFPTGEAL